ncbi:hypothetical protein Tco_0360749 [Tanacetum coccineum]
MESSTCYELNDPTNGIRALSGFLSFVARKIIGLILLNSFQVSSLEVCNFYYCSSRELTRCPEETEGALQLGPERARVFTDLSAEEKERYKADIRATNILLQGIPKDIYTLINHFTDAKDIWDNVKMILEGSELTKEGWESQLYDDEFKRFCQIKGETIHVYYVRFSKLINDMRNIKMTMSRMQLNSKFRDGNVNPGQAKPILCILNAMESRAYSTRMRHATNFDDVVDDLALQCGPCLLSWINAMLFELMLMRLPLHRPCSWCTKSGASANSRLFRIAPHIYSKENLLATFAPQRNLTPEQIFWSIDNNDRGEKKAETSVPITTFSIEVYPPNTPIKLVPRVLPTKSQVKINLYVLTQLFTEFDKTCKKRITPTGVTEGERGFEQTKRCYLTEVIPFFPKHIKEYFEGVQTDHLKEVKVNGRNFDQMSDEVDRNVWWTSNIKNLEHQIQEKDNVIRDLKVLVSNVNDRSCEPYNANDVTDLLEQNERLRAEIEKVKQHYKEMFESIKITRTSTNEQTSSLLTQIEDLKAQLEGILKVVH